MTNKRIQIIILILLFIFAFSACSKEVEILSDRTFALDTLTSVKVYHYKSDKIDEATLEGAFELIHDLENTLSAHIENSDIDKINQNAGKSAVVVDALTYRVMQDSIHFSNLTDGLFDITTGPLIDLWAINPPDGHVPSENELDKTLPLIDYSQIDFMDDNKVMLKSEDMSVNLGAIAKGTIADAVKHYLIGEGVRSALINLGGNILLLNSKLDGSDFVIGIQNPNDDRGAYLMSINVSDKAMVSSGDYERFFEYDGEIYHHILNPKTGYPATTNIKQVTIVAPNSQMADGLSTSVLLVGLKDGIDLIESTEGVEAVFITKDKKIYITDGLRCHSEYEEQQMKDYTLVDDKQALY
jgi:FAD:protein FMN transferase